jgi:hypothetical protein
MTLPESLNAALLSARPGDIVDAIEHIPLASLPALAWRKKAGGPPLVFSDDPEYFRVPEGAGVREDVPAGVFRLYTYHVNALREQPRRITAVLENRGDKPLSMRFLKYAFQGPDTDYYSIGKNGLVQFFESKPRAETITIPVGGAVPIDPDMEKVQVLFDQLVHGFYEIEIDQPARVTVLQTDPATPGPEAARRIREVLPPNNPAGAGRGLYPFSHYDITLGEGNVLDTAGGAMQLIVADGKTDPWIEGHDSSTSGPCRLAGNYGLTYKIRVPWKSGDGRGLALLTWNPRSRDQWCGGMANAVVVNAGKYPAGIVQVPRERTHVKGDEAVFVQLYPPPAEGQTGLIEILYSPPGASCLPTPLIFVPIKME